MSDLQKARIYRKEPREAFFSEIGILDGANGDTVERKLSEWLSEWLGHRRTGYRATTFIEGEILLVQWNNGNILPLRVERAEIEVRRVVLESKEAP